MSEENNIISYKELLLTRPFSLNMKFQYYEYQKYVKKMRKR
ncbi:hypothetical protein CLSAP_29600 [Clostridium saccharoperbutylacetonicum]|nr:hypothetical protein CLSAP_29600 [Clostridium saccharoperbutylacetonicum]NSB31507.1 hypothetical protein [Clostridium saccharoperbutylacetonicum]